MDRPVPPFNGEPRLDHIAVLHHIVGDETPVLPEQAENIRQIMDILPLGSIHKDKIIGPVQSPEHICRISLNGRELDRVKNMHRAYTYDVKELLRPGKNTLRLEFASPTRYFAERHAKHYLYTNDGDTIPGAAHLRKALYQSGWDWGPALPDMGIYRPVTLEGYDVDRIGDVAVRQHHREDGSVELLRRAETPEDYFATVVW